MTTQEIIEKVKEANEIIEQIEELKGMIEQLNEPHWNDKESQQDYAKRIEALEVNLHALWKTT